MTLVFFFSKKGDTSVSMGMNIIAINVSSYKEQHSLPSCSAFGTSKSLESCIYICSLRSTFFRISCCVVPFIIINCALCSIDITYIFVLCHVQRVKNLYVHLHVFEL